MGDFMYFHGQISKEFWDQLRGCCAPGTIYCDVSQYINNDGTLNTNTNCGKIIEQMTEERIYKSALDVYNIYQDCYGYSTKSFGKSVAEQEEERAFHIRENAKHKHDNRPATFAAYVSQFTRMNFKSTDSNGGFQCYMVDAIQKYLNQSSVRDALNIPDYVQPFEFC
uniref:Uncharacterized protein n=1 Tax=Panagrolaimus sp. JU765 TaxID=591449 RepID=A0AC34RC30_9BILA